MYKVLIADDENSIVNSLRGHIDWRKYGLEVAAIASNGEIALEIIEKQPIDIVITDIRMPQISGLELCMELYTKYKHIQIIVISGYAEFSYAQKAIKYGILGYCLKPLEYEEITAYLKTAVNSLRKVSSSLTYDDFLDYVQNKDTRKIHEFMQRYNMDAKSYYVAVSVGTNPMELPENSCVRFRLGKQQYVYIMNQVLPKECIEAFVSKDENLCLGIADTAQPIERLMQSIENCRAAAYQFFVNPVCKVSYCTKEDKSEKYIPEVAKALAYSDSETIIKILTRIKFSTDFSDFTVKSVLKLCNMIFTSNIFPHEKEDYYIYSMQELITEYGSFSLLLDRLCELISPGEIQEITWNEFSNSSFLKMMKYINNHYNEDISLSEIAHKIHLNPNYLSQMFKKEMGVTFTKYLTGLRISKAKELLDEEEIPINEIAIQVGFNDYFYFLKTFKRVAGKTPSQYRIHNTQ